MNYTEFEQEIMHMAASATNAAWINFAVDTIGLLRRSAEVAIPEELTETEHRMLSEILVGVQQGSMAGLRPKLQELDDSLSKDEVRAIEFHPDIIELLCALDSLFEYMGSKDPKFIGRIAVSMVNSIDYAISGNSAGYSTEDMMAAEQMRSEYARQKGLLVSTGAGAGSAF